MNRERVQMLRDMLAGIPEGQIYLDTYYAANGNPCNTIACIAGWAAIYPPFVKEGLRATINEFGWRGVAYNNQAIGDLAAATFFGVPYRIFAQKLARETGTHKEIALRRLDNLLAE